jgi:hypothetical protein
MTQGWPSWSISTLSRLKSMAADDAHRRVTVDDLGGGDDVIDVAFEQVVPGRAGGPSSGYQTEPPLVGHRFVEPGIDCALRPGQGVDPSQELSSGRVVDVASGVELDPFVDPVPRPVGSDGNGGPFSREHRTGKRDAVCQHRQLETDIVAGPRLDRTYELLHRPTAALGRQTPHEAELAPRREDGRFEHGPEIECLHDQIGRRRGSWTSDPPIMAPSQPSR